MYFNRCLCTVMNHVSRIVHTMAPCWKPCKIWWQMKMYRITVCLFCRGNYGQCISSWHGSRGQQKIWLCFLRKAFYNWYCMWDMVVFIVIWCIALDFSTRAVTIGTAKPHSLCRLSICSVGVCLNGQEPWFWNQSRHWNTWKEVVIVHETACHFVVLAIPWLILLSRSLLREGNVENFRSCFPL